LDIEIVKIEKIFGVHWVKFKQETNPFNYNAGFINGRLVKEITHETQFQYCPLCKVMRQHQFHKRCAYFNTHNHMEILEKELREKMRTHKDRLKLISDGLVL